LFFQAKGKISSVAAEITLKVRSELENATVEALAGFDERISGNPRYRRF